MTWITDNWVGILLGLAFIAFHLFGHRGHGGGHKHGAGPPAAKVDHPILPEQPPTMGSANQKAMVDATERLDAELAAAPPDSRGHHH